MISLDTNVLVRALVDDTGQPAQTAQARQAIATAQQVYITQIVQAELVWVLETNYRLDKNLIVMTLEHLADNYAYVLQNAKCFAAALLEFKAGRADFADYLILCESRSANATLLTFDKHLLSSPATRRPDQA